MKGTRNFSTRNMLIIMGLMAVVGGLSSCDGEADHYYVIFGATPSNDPGCATYCTATDSVFVGDKFKVSRGDRVQFINVTNSMIKITLTYRYPDNAAEDQSFNLGKGKSKKIKIRENLPQGGTEILFRYEIDESGHGGPGMIVEP